MKKLLTVLAIAALAITSTFAASENRNIQINGQVSQNEYTFDLANADSKVTDSDYLYASGDAIDLTETTLTSEFLIQRSNGNENTDSSLIVEITPSQFVGTVNGSSYETGIIPAVQWEKYENASTDGNYGKVFLPYGYKAAEETVAGFKLNIVGDVSTPASSDYSSTIKVAYTFDN